jgi:hypothetical protein
MNAAQILADVQLVLSVAKQTLELGLDAKPFVADALQIVVKHQPLSTEQRFALQARETALRNQIDAAVADDDAAD